MGINEYICISQKPNFTTMEKYKDTMKIILYVIVFSYLLISQLMTFIFWLDMMLEHNIITVIFIAPFIAEYKGLLWPFYI